MTECPASAVERIARRHTHSSCVSVSLVDSSSATDRQTNRQADKQTGRQTDRQTCQTYCVDQFGANMCEWVRVVLSARDWSCSGPVVSKHVL